MPRLAFRLAAAFLAFLAGLGAEQFVRVSRSQLDERRTTSAPPTNHPLEQATASTSRSGVNVPQADSVTGTVASLHQIKTIEDFGIPSAARPLLTRLKHQIRDVIAETINAKGNESLPPESLRRTVWDQLATRGVTIEQPRDGTIDEDSIESSYSFGEVYDIEIQKPNSSPELLAVTTTLQIPCGSDSSLYVFQRSDQPWKLVLAQEANDYAEVSGAQGIFSYAISPAETDNNFFVVTVNVNPWCTSNWQSIRYSVLRIGLGAYQPRMLVSGEQTIYLGVGPPPYRLEVGRKWFSITFEGDSSDAEVMNGINSRKHVVKYMILGDRARRVRS
jgi:hypothetical protein